MDGHGCGPAQLEKLGQKPVHRTEFFDVRADGHFAAAFATRDIAAGTCILSEQPLLTLDTLALMPEVDGLLVLDICTRMYTQVAELLRLIQASPADAKEARAALDEATARCGCGQRHVCRHANTCRHARIDVHISGFVSSAFSVVLCSLRHQDSPRQARPVGCIDGVSRAVESPHLLVFFFLWADDF